LSKIQIWNFAIVHLTLLMSPKTCGGRGAWKILEMKNHNEGELRSGKG
jgi:hypothetical protein